jgi:hypothetical protein
VTPAKLCILLAALAAIARARVALLPGWVVPVPVVLLASELLLCTAGTGFLIWRARRRPPGRHRHASPAPRVIVGRLA